MLAPRHVAGTGPPPESEESCEFLAIFMGQIDAINKSCGKSAADHLLWSCGQKAIKLVESYRALKQLMRCGTS
jgi:hypothetical protein